MAHSRHGLGGDWSQTILRQVTTRQAFIYFLEIYAQVIMVAALAPILPKEWISFIDNQAGRAALMKGWGTDERVNLLLECFWKFAASRHWRPHFEWVPSHCNITDPISREDFTMARQKGWVHVPIADGPLRKLLSNKTVDLEIAHLDGARVLASLVSARCRVERAPRVEINVAPAPKARED